MAKRFISSHDTKSEAERVLHETAELLVKQGLAERYGAKVEPRSGVHYVVVVERGTK